MEETYIKSTLTKQDTQFDNSLRPSSLAEFIGQPKLKERLNIYIGAAKMRSEPLGHALFYGPPGLGKTTLAKIVAAQMGTKLTMTSGPAIEKPGDLAGILTSLEEGDILFIDEIHRLSRAIEEYLYSAMEDFSLDLMLDSGANARSVRITLNRFTLVGATTRLGLLTNALRSRFGFVTRLDYYPIEELEKIASRTSNILCMPLEKEAATAVAKRSRGAPRICNNLLRWVRDYAQMQEEKTISQSSAIKALEMLAIDHLGLDEMDKKMLETIIGHFDGGPVGLNTLATSLGEDSATIEEVHEPFLVMQGFIKRTLRGREATQMAYKHLGIDQGEKS